MGIAVGGYIYFRNTTLYVTSDDALVHSNLTPVAVTGAGTLQTWLIEPGTKVRVGQTIGFTLQPVQVIALSAVTPRHMPRATALFSVMRQVVVAFGTALLATHVQNRTPVHFARLAEQATPFSPAGDFVNQVTVRLQAQGLDQLHAYAAALQAPGRQLRQEAIIFAYDDAFMLTTLILIGGIILSLLLRPVTIEGGEQAAPVE